MSRCCYFFCCCCQLWKRKYSKRSKYGSLEESNQYFTSSSDESPSFTTRDGTVQEGYDAKSVVHKHGTATSERRSLGREKSQKRSSRQSVKRITEHIKIEKVEDTAEPTVEVEITFIEKESSFSSESDTQSLDSPMLQFSLYYDQEHSKLSVTLRKGLGIFGRENSVTDTYVVLYLDPNREEILESQVKYKTSKPVYNEVFQFHRLLASEIPMQKLVLRVYESKRQRRNECLGSVVLPLKEADLLGASMTKKLNDNPSELSGLSEGDILLSLMYSSQDAYVEGTVLKATNLRPADNSGSVDPYVKVYLYYRGSRVSKWKSTIKKNTLVPVYNESFHFNMFQMNTSEVHLQVVVMNYDRITRNLPMGIVSIGSSVVQSISGQKHWSEMISTPHHAVSRWHSLSSTVEKAQVGEQPIVWKTL